MMLNHHLIFLIGISLMCRKTLAFPKCSVVGWSAIYDWCNLTRVPPVPENITLLSLNFNFIQDVNATSFPLLMRLTFLSLGAQKAIPVTIRNEAFRNLPNLQHLDLGDNKMLQLEPDAFVGLSALGILRLYGNGLDESILEEGYLRDSVSLEYLDLAYNKITRLRPHPSFDSMTFLQILDLKLNRIEVICEGDLNSFQGKAIILFILNSNRLYTNGNSMDWATCGNPLKNIFIDTLDVGGNGWDVATTQKFCTAIQGSPLVGLKLSYHGMGSSFGHNNLRDPDNGTFAGLARSGLRLLDISNGHIFSLNPYVFQYLTVLELLNLHKNKINQIQKEAFFGLGNLQRLNLSNNLLGELYDYSFKGLHNVLEINLQYNHIGVIDRAPFKHLPKLQTLDLRDNALSTIESLPYMNYVFLGDNRLTSTGTHKIMAINASFLDLKGNRLSNLRDLYEFLQIPDLQYLILRYNRLAYCEECNKSCSDVAENSQLTYLDLGDNMLRLVWESSSCLDVFKGLSKLHTLHLNNNYLSFLPEGIFDGLVSLYRLNLAYNQLTYIYHRVFPRNLRRLELSHNHLLYPNSELFATLDFLDITYNKFYCDCHLISRIAQLNHTNLTLAGSPEDMFCFGPPELAGVPLYELPIDDCSEDKVLEPLQLSLFIFTCVTLIVFLLVVIVFARFRGTCFVLYRTVIRTFLKERQPESDRKTCKYDAYLCYSNRDFEWVQNSLIKHLDSQYSDKNRFTLCFEARDFLPGEDHIVNIRDAIWNSRKTICIVTKQFLKDGWCVEAFNFAQSRYFCDLKDILIMVVAGSLSQYQLMKYNPVRVYLQRGQYYRWPEENQDVEWFLHMLSHQILKEEVKKKISATLELQNVAIT
ncbi:toll-like receptor 5 [Tiliqua scincoides]|uniref:toll-like receptor 5 n=1 Tax=Tiliqua scincoides TaxID=71010 RepID=UPI003461982A